MPVGFHDGTAPRLISQWNKARTICSLSSSVQLKTLPDLNFFSVPSSSVDDSTFVWWWPFCNRKLSRMSIRPAILYFCLLGFGAFYFCTQSSEEGAVNRICFSTAWCECLPIRNRIMPVPGQWCRFQTIPASCKWDLSFNIVTLLISKRDILFTLVWSMNGSS